MGSKRFEDTDIQSFAEGCMVTIDANANRERAKALLRTQSIFRLSDEEVDGIVLGLKRKGLMPQSFRFNKNREEES